MQRYDFFSFLQNFREKKLNIYRCFNIRLRFAAISVGVHIILYRGAARVLRLCSRLPVRPKTASTKRGYTPLSGIATHFLHLHEAALRRNVAYGEGCRSSPMARPTTRTRVNGGKLDGEKEDAKGQWSQMPVMEWPLRRLGKEGLRKPRC